MPLRTTVIGAYPKPDYVPITDWFQMRHDDKDYTAKVQASVDAGEAAQDVLDRATGEVIADQIACGIDIPTDGEVRRENYVHYQCRHMDGFDFDNLTHVVLRNGAYEADLPTITAPIRSRGQSVLVRDWQVAQAASDRPVKITLPGPLTISDTTADGFYNDAPKLAADLADALNAEVLALVEAGAKYIQIDEPIFARKPDAALAYGMETLQRCFHNVPKDVTRVMHMCCGYPTELDEEDYPKADQHSYAQIARAVDGLVDQISIEDAHRYNPPELFELYQKSKLIVGFVTIASSKVEPVEQIRARMLEVLKYVPAERLIAAPDCGLGFLGRDLAMVKLRNMVEAARSV